MKGKKLGHLSFEEIGLVDGGAIHLPENFAYAWPSNSVGARGSYEGIGN